jgi:hypothetical protein
MKYEQYKTLGTLQNANSIKTKIDTDGDITFSLSNVRYVFKINHLNKVNLNGFICLSDNNIYKLSKIE